MSDLYPNVWLSGLYSGMQKYEKSSETLRIFRIIIIFAIGIGGRFFSTLKNSYAHAFGVAAFLYESRGSISEVCLSGKCIRMSTPFLCPYICTLFSINLMTRL